MSVPEATHRRTGRRGALRLSASVAALWLGLGAGPAAAAVIGSFTWNSNTAAYNAFAATCPGVSGGGAACTGTEPSSGYTTTVNRSDSNGGGAFGSGTIFGWGTNIAGEALLNSKLTWINDGAAFTLDSIKLTSVLPVGTGLPTSNPAIIPGTGTGAAPVWEWVGLDLAMNTLIEQSMVGISIAGGAAVTDHLLAGAGGWFPAPNYRTQQTPVVFTTDAALPKLLINPGQWLDIRIFESIWNGRGTGSMAEGLPDLLFASITIEISGTPIGNVPLPGTLALLGIGIAALRLRSGQPLRVTRGLLA